MVMLSLPAALLFGLQIHPFLAVTERVATDVLVVEGWIHEHAIRGAVQEFTAGSYRQVYTTGGPVVGTGGYTNDFNTAASVGADLLRAHGVPSSALQIVSSRVAARNRTYGSAVALRNWLRENRPGIRSLNVVTEDGHARRTQLLFQLALGPDFNVGVVSIPNPDYDARRWWRYSEGVREVLGETIAYVYVKLFFFPSPAEASGVSGPVK